MRAASNRGTHISHVHLPRAPLCAWQASASEMQDLLAQEKSRCEKLEAQAAADLAAHKEQLDAAQEEHEADRRKADQHAAGVCVNVQRRR